MCERWKDDRKEGEEAITTDLPHSVSGKIKTNSVMCSVTEDLNYQVLDSLAETMDFPVEYYIQDPVQVK